MASVESMLKVFDSIKMTTPKGKVVIKTDEQIDQFIEQLNLDYDGVDLYMLGYLGGCKKYGRFYRNELEKVVKLLNPKKPLSQELNNRFNALEGESYVKFLGVVYDWVDIMLKELQSHQPTGEKVNLKISGFVPIEGRTEMVDILQPLLSAIIQPKYKNDVFEQFIYFVINYKKRRLMRKDEIQFLIDFLIKYPNMKAVKNSDDDTCYFPILYDEFIEYVQNSQK
ncbi:hypothetical protein EHI8A_093000 [Entamoeba histolytica HM-1:IMSS-B]|uniref:Uncharacterized protein n=6 Tax=Entamoeba histolytica TaxID=5759 RepID=C4LSU5_ENTH1|nr:hypothetical protein EHI_152590 [Entamoeba histolytica HM-1:IMSS]EMD49266.1 Hypothetical protein EHI5A_000690 [Entamoeba histolytica KU27]EMH77958.1 hypothetical protein EHI8A_093000 [Entamoeba histolytica HM-1:IMSS-B]EMS10827.1 hypothetical protein KM1_002210 [Entamoeba histolytica HM-3:IMSS]ENY61921.1 hypothetical protein EHI7A_018750 [Entamoeba histolytica HM-1:IMSS-A]GAT91512.1 hypothetical protein CL6EHI_152590 [Entamoeba histolytica]|eukprot:XP_656952.1 hypothetical protein EHI_152590 [Entamoeba histolytica HM-1:IMSS]